MSTPKKKRRTAIHYSYDHDTKKFTFTVDVLAQMFEDIREAERKKESQ